MKKNSRSPLMSSSSANMRSLSPLPRPRNPASHRKSGVMSHSLDMTEDSEISENEMHKGNEHGIRYITENLIQKLSKQENLAFAITLNLSLSKDGGKKFKYIENLEKCEKLEVLNLGHNLIEKIEKLEKQSRLRELNLSHNRISKIEGLEHMYNLQKLNLAGNEIEHIPVWIGKKLRALSTLNLKQNKIFSLQDVSRLKTLKDLTLLVLSDNPIADLPHYRLYIIFHLRSLNVLDGQPITNQERQSAHERFNMEEVEKLERDLDKKMREIEDLQGQKAKALNDLQHQGELNKSLKKETQQHKKSYKELEQEMDTKNELLKQKTLELTRACQKQYELEQELAFYKIDAKFEPLGYLTEEIDAEETPGESPYIGKARYKRNLYSQETFIPDHVQQLQVGKIELDGDEQIKNQQIRARIHTTLDIDLNEKERNIQTAQEQLSELQQEIIKSEQQILKATEELKELEDAVAQRKILETEKDKLRQQLGQKIQLLNEMRQEAQELERQMDRQRKEMDEKYTELEELQRHLDSLSPNDPRHAHVRAQKASKEQQLEMMDRQYKQLEGRLDEMLSRIARETEEIKDLEQQLTEGQIAANEALKRDLEGIISGLQEYLDSVKGQAKQAHDECRELQSEREILLQRLEELEEERERLEAAVQDTEDMKKEMEELEHNLQEQQELNESLRQAQGDLNAYEAQLEEQLRAGESEIRQLKQELERRKRQGHAESSALKAELERDRHALENALTKAQMLEERDKDSKKLLAQLQQLQRENESMRKQLKNEQDHLNEALQNLVHPEQITARVSELKRKLQTGVGEIRSSSPSDILGQNLAELQQQINEVLGKAEEEKREAEERQRKLQEEMAALQEKAKEAPGEYKKACNKAAEARIQQEKRESEAKVRQLEREARQLNEKLKTMEEIQSLADQQLVEADEERERLLTALQDFESERKIEAAKAQKQLSGLDNELRELKKALAMSDKMATSELTDAKDQLRSLHGTVLQINRERAKEMHEAKNVCSQIAQATRDLAKAEAEIDLLQELLQEKDRQVREEMQNADSGAAISNSKQLEIDKLKQTLQRQRAEIERLRHALDHIRADNSGEIDNLLEEIDSLRNALGYQSDYITSMTDPFRRRGYWYYVPSSSNNSGRDSISTKDSGVSLHYPLTSSPAYWKGGHRRHGKKEKLSPPGRGHWVYSPFRHGHHRCYRDDEIDGASQSDSGDAQPCHFVPPHGSVIYTVFPDGTPVPQGTVIYGPAPPSNGRPVAPGTVVYGPPPIGSQFVYGPPPPQFTIPVIPAGVLHCNVSAHHNLENEVARLEDIIDHLNSRHHREKREKTQLRDDIEELERCKQTLGKEVEDLRSTSLKFKRHHFKEGQLGNLITELELERSLQHHDSIGDEIECLEKTLVKRRVEFREADRLLAEAEDELKNTQDKTAGLIETYSTAKKHLSQTEHDAEELERRAQETAVNLVKADQQLRILQTNARDLEQHIAEQENILLEINSIVSAKDTEFQSLNHKVQIVSDSLQKLQDDIQAAEEKKDYHLQTLKEAENLLVDKTKTLDRLSSQILAQQEEITELDRLLGQKKEEFHLLQDHIELKKADLKEVLRDGELETAERRQEIKEVKSLLDSLNVEKGELSAQLNEKRSQLSKLKQEVIEEEESLQTLTSQIHKQKTELKHVLEMQQLETNELRGLKLQHDQKINELEKTQSLLLQGKLELENVQMTLQRIHGQVDLQKQLLEKDHQEIELLMTQMHTLQENVQILNGEKEHLEKISDDLERKLSHNKKALADTEESTRTASCTLDKFQSDIKNIQNEINQLSKQKQLLRQETTDAHHTLQETKEEVKLLQEELTDMRDQHRVVEQDLRNTTKQRNDMLCEQSTFQDETSEMKAQYRLLQEKESRKEEHLRQVQRTIEGKACEIKQQESRLKQIMKDIEHQEDELRSSTARLEDQGHKYERELSNQQNILDRMNAKVLALEEHARKLKQEERWCADLEESLATARHLLSEHEEQLQDKTNAMLALQKEAELYRIELCSLREQMSSEKKNYENRIMMLNEAIAKQRHQIERMAEEQRLESSSLKKQLLEVEQDAYESHERAKRLLKELKHLQAEHAMLGKQLKSQEELDNRQQGVNEAVKELKAQVKREIQSTLQDLHCSVKDGLEEDAEAALEHNHSFRSQLEILKENFPFTTNSTSESSPADQPRSYLTDEQLRGEALREKLQQEEDRLKAQLHQQIFKQADVLSRGRQQTEGSLYNLRRQVNALDELVNNTSSDSSFHSQNSLSYCVAAKETRSLNCRASISPIPVSGLSGIPQLFSSGYSATAGHLEK